MRSISAVAIASTVALGLAIGVPPPPAHAQQQPAEDARARELFLEGEAHYAAGRYELAAERYLEAYELSQRAELLFNVGNAYERLGDYEKAAKYLGEYVNTPRARDVVSVRERIRRLEAAAVEQKRRDEQEQQQAVTPDPVVEPPTTSREPDSGLSRSTWWFIGSGASAAGAIGLGLLALNAGNNASRDCAGTGRPVCRDTASSSLTQETVFAIGADVLAVATVVTAGVGVYLLFQGDETERRPVDSTSTQIVPTLGPDGVGVSLSGRF
jgi:tetratricopeptide (TPR) repeat protein